MKYKPSRDIPQAVRELRTLSPSSITNWVREHRKERKGRIEQQCSIGSDAVGVWIKRHPEVQKELSGELSALALDNVLVNTGLFENGAFRESQSIANWIRELTNKGAKVAIIGTWTNIIKRVCQGILPKESGTIPEWGLKHPDKLNLEDAKTYIYEMKKRNLRTREVRLALRNFFSSKNIVVKSVDISGELEEDAGKYADLFVGKERIYQLLDAIKTRSIVAYQASFFAYKTASRLTAVLTAEAQYINTEEKVITVFEKSVKGKAKKRVVKLISSDLWEVMPKEGTLFPIDAATLNETIRAAMKEVIPELEPRIKMPFHFWRHMFAQHMLRASGWNLALVARLGNWSVEALERYYGKADWQTVRTFGLQTIPTI